MTIKCKVAGHSMKHFLITTVEEFDDRTGGPATTMTKVINRKCMHKGCSHTTTELTQYGPDL